MATSTSTRQPVPGFMPDEAQHRRRIADWMREIHQGRFGGDIDTPGTISAGVKVVAPNTAKAWCAFSGVGVVTLQQSYNVASITDGGVGTYQINLTNALSGTGYSVLAFCEHDGVVMMVPQHSSAGAKTTSGYQITVQNPPTGAVTDSPVVHIGFMGT